MPTVTTQAREGIETHKIIGAFCCLNVTTQAREGIETLCMCGQLALMEKVTTQAREGIETDHPESQVIQA